MAEEITKVEQIVEEIKAVGTHNEKQLAELKTAMDNRDNANAKQLDAVKTEIDTKMAELGKSIETNKTITKPEKEFKSFGDFMHKAFISGEAEQYNLKNVKTLSGETGADGGYLVPEEQTKQIYKVNLENTVIRGGGAKVINMASKTLDVPAIKSSSNASGSIYGGATTYWVGAQTTVTGSSYKAEKIKLVVHKLAGVVDAEDELSQDAFVSIANLNAEIFGETLAFEEDYAFINGTGLAEPVGIINSDCAVSYSRLSATQVQTVDVIGMYARALHRGGGQYMWLANQSILPQLMQLRDANDNYIWTPSNSASIANGIPGSLYGYPVKITEKCSALGTKGDLMLVNLSYYLIGDRQKITMEKSKEFRFTEFIDTWRIALRVDGKPWLNSAITPRAGGDTLSPFVILS